MKYLIANWKMNKLDFLSWQNKFLEDFQIDKSEDTKIIVCGHAADYSVIDASKHEKILLGAQDVSRHKEGAYTGQISASILKSKNISTCLVGHSEKREDGDTNEIVYEKAKQLEKEGIEKILCIGESLEILNEGLRKNFLQEQLNLFLNKNILPDLIAYEPIWAIGTGKAASVNSIGEAVIIVHEFIKNFDKEIPLLYGGSVSSKNISEIMSIKRIDGCLVGNASLDAKEFANIASQI
tara:strand:- start:299 stop:1012 length:714 start_codon:yes stop_codon:yes gene_type:complete